MCGKTCFSARLVFVVGGVERGEGSLISLTDFLELLHVAASGSEIDLGDLELRTARKKGKQRSVSGREETHRSSATSCSSCCSRGRSGSGTGAAALPVPVVLRSYTASFSSLPWSWRASSSTRSWRCVLLVSAQMRDSRVWASCSDGLCAYRMSTPLVDL